MASMVRATEGLTTRRTGSGGKSLTVVPSAATTRRTIRGRIITPSLAMALAARMIWTADTATS